MKNSNYILLLLFVLFTFSCEKEEKESKADYQALGVTSITINGKQIPVNNGTLLDLTNVSSITVNRTESNVAKKQILMSYAVVTTPGSSLSIEVKSSCTTTSIVMVEEQIDNLPSYKVVVTREGYREQITYIFKPLYIPAH